MPPTPLAEGLVALFGLAFGSFLNVCIVRLPRGESVITPRSHCPRCNRPIRWFDNLPVLSYVILGARCRHCRQPISILYPLVEILTAALLVVTFARYGLGPEFIKYAALGMFLLILIFTDLRERQIPRPVTLLGTAIGILLSLFVPVDNRPLDWALSRFGVSLEGSASSVAGAVSGALFGAGFFYLVGEAFYRLRHKEGLGFGDVMLMLMVGSFLGIPLTLLTILIGSILGVLIAVPLYFISSRFREYEWPYGSFLGAAALYASLGGTRLLEAYLRWSGLG
jgi:leader peptidase (prepilin peptidase) / N-methyltransferase